MIDQTQIVLIGRDGFEVARIPFDNGTAQIVLDNATKKPFVFAYEGRSFELETNHIELMRMRGRLIAREPAPTLSARNKPKRRRTPRLFIVGFAGEVVRTLELTFDNAKRIAELSAQENLAFEQSGRFFVVSAVCLTKGRVLATEYIPETSKTLLTIEEILK